MSDKPTLHRFPLLDLILFLDSRITPARKKIGRTLRGVTAKCRVRKPSSHRCAHDKLTSKRLQDRDRFRRREADRPVAPSTPTKPIAGQQSQLLLWMIQCQLLPPKARVHGIRHLIRSTARLVRHARRWRLDVAERTFKLDWLYHESFTLFFFRRRADTAGRCLL